MEIINGYIESMSLGTTVYNNITPETSSYNISSNIYFFNGSYDTEVLYNVLNEATLLSTYASQYLGKVTNVSLDFTYNDSKKQRIIKQPIPNTLRFKDERYLRTTYTMGSVIPKPIESNRFKIKINNSAVIDGFKVNGNSVVSTVNETKLPFKSYNTGTFNIEFIVNSTTDITISNDVNPYQTSIEIIPLDDNDKPIQRTIDWCAIKIKNDANGDYFIYLDDIGTRDNPSSLNLFKKESVYGDENILNSVKIDLRNKSVGEI